MGKFRNVGCRWIRWNWSKALGGLRGWYEKSYVNPAYICCEMAGGPRGSMKKFPHADPCGILHVAGPHYARQVKDG